jgi:hypothetical protein
VRRDVVRKEGAPMRGEAHLPMGLSWARPRGHLPMLAYAMKRSFAYAWTHSERLYDGAICLCVHRHIGLCLAYAWIGSALARDFGMCAGAPGKRHAGGRLRRDCPSRPRGRGCPAWLSRAWPSRTGAPKVTERAESRIFVGQISTSAHIDGWPTRTHRHRV